MMDDNQETALIGIGIGVVILVLAHFTGALYRPCEMPFWFEKDTIAFVLGIGMFILNLRWNL